MAKLNKDNIMALRAQYIPEKAYGIRNTGVRITMHETAAFRITVVLTDRSLVADPVAHGGTDAYYPYFEIEKNKQSYFARVENIDPRLSYDRAFRQDFNRVRPNRASFKVSVFARGTMARALDIEDSNIADSIADFCGYFYYGLRYDNKYLGF